MERLLEFMEKAGLSAMFISRPVNVKYVSHYTGEDSFLFITENSRNSLLAGTLTDFFRNMISF